MDTSKSWLPGSVLEAIGSLGDSQSVYLVGGAVRDALLQKPGRDFDFVLTGEVKVKSKKIADLLGGDFYPLDENRKMMRVLWYPDAREVITLDFSELQGDSIEADLRARDFTINAMAVDMQHPEKIIDPLGGALDLKDHRLRHCRKGNTLSDPVRALRAVRLAVQFQLTLEPETISEVRQASGEIGRISPERIRDELFRILNGHKVAVSIRIMQKFGLLQAILPEIIPLTGVRQSSPHEFDVYEHSLATLDRLEALVEMLASKEVLKSISDLTMAEAYVQLNKYRVQIRDHLQERINGERTRAALLFFSALYHDAAKPNTATLGVDGKIHFYGHETLGAQIGERRMKSLACSNQEGQIVERIIRNHMRPNLLRKQVHPLSDRAIYRFYRSCGEDGIEICLLSMADMLAKKASPPDRSEWNMLCEINRKLLHAWFDEREQKITPPRLIDGDDITRNLGIEPGPKVGEILVAVAEAQVSGEIQTHEEALQYARDWMQKGDILEDDDER
jgi:poly(A) polymerase